MNLSFWMEIEREVSGMKYSHPIATVSLRAETVVIVSFLYSKSPLSSAITSTGHSGLPGHVSQTLIPVGLKPILRS